MCFEVTFMHFDYVLSDISCSLTDWEEMGSGFGESGEEMLVWYVV